MSSKHPVHPVHPGHDVSDHEVPRAIPFAKPFATSLVLQEVRAENKPYQSQIYTPYRALKDMDEQESFRELHASTEALLEAVLQFGAELVHAAPRASEDQNDQSAETERVDAPQDSLDESLTAYFAKSFDLRRRNAETQFSVAIIALAKSGAKHARAQQ